MSTVDSWAPDEGEHACLLLLNLMTLDGLKKRERNPTQDPEDVPGWFLLSSKFQPLQWVWERRRFDDAMGLLEKAQSTNIGVKTSFLENGCRSKSLQP